MSNTEQVKKLLDGLEDTRELVLVNGVHDYIANLSDERFAAWSEARTESNRAYTNWRLIPGRDTYLVYRAAEDRADAAAAMLRRGCRAARTLA